MRTVIACFLALGVGAAWGAGPADVTARVERLGNPLARRYPDGSAFHYARTVSDLRAFDGKLYVGHGDIVLNSGPTDIWYYDLRKKEFVRQGQIEDEAADHYRVIGGRLYLPGMDPREDWSLGNFYRLEGGRWVKHRTLPHSVHSSDIVGVGNTLFALSARPKPPMCLLASGDDGKTWKSYDAPAGYPRLGRRLFVLGGNLYVTAGDAAGDVRVYRFNGGGFDPCRGDMLPGAEVPPRDPPTSHSWSALERPTVFEGGLVYIGARHRVIFTEKDVNKAWPPYRTLGLFAAAPSGPTGLRARRVLTGEELTDIATDGRRCYVVGFRWQSATDPRRGAVSTVFASADLEHWSVLFSFRADTFASALEVIDGDFYLGLGGTRTYCTPSTGMILKVGKEQLK
ncbi:MAG TPA: hypothetical protein VJ739_02680 [Gemmataceae bacterium]|nr:hypothetical protein [Gemmataceae bacterium]